MRECYHHLIDIHTSFQLENGLETPCVLHLTSKDELLLSQTTQVFTPETEEEINKGNFRKIFPVILGAKVIWDAEKTRFEQV